MTFSEEYTDLENRVVQEFTKKREKLVEIDFLNANTNFEDFDDYQSALEDCPTSYYNHKHSGEEKHIYVTKIDSEGIHVVDSDDYSNKLCIGLNDLNGLYYKIALLEDIEKFVNNIEHTINVYDVIQVARELKFNPTVKQIHEVIAIYPSEQLSDTTATWNLVVEQCLYSLNVEKLK